VVTTAAYPVGVAAVRYFLDFREPDVALPLLDREEQPSHANRQIEPGSIAGSDPENSRSSAGRRRQRRCGGSASAAQSVTLPADGRVSPRFRSASGAVGTMVLDDTNSVVAAGKTKVRVLHLAPNAGTLQVYRTQPDFQQPVPWQLPFNYQAEVNSLSAPFYESTVGT
jgi:hypothetical protein